MKLHADTAEGVNLIRSFEPGRILVNADLYTGSIIVPPTGPVELWPRTTVDTLTADDFERLALAAPEVIIFGSGARLRFPPPVLLRPLMSARIGIETMDTAAACRTYNILVAEGRKVMAALLMP